MSNKTIRVETLRDWLDSGKPVTVLDVRPAARRADGAIPDSLQMDVFEALKRGDPDALTEIELPRDRPVVTVCTAGNSSATAAEQLRARGLDALVLEGGMQAWKAAEESDTEQRQ